MDLTSSNFEDIFLAMTEEKKEEKDENLIDKHKSITQDSEINVEEDELMDLIATARSLSIRGLSDSDEDSRGKYFD